MKYNFNKMLLDFSYAKEFFLDFDYRDQIAYNLIHPSNEKETEGPNAGYGYRVSNFKELGNEIVVDSKTKYTLNSRGYRSPEFEKVDLIFSGCSHTYGVGVPEEAIWGVKVAESLGLSYANVALSGQSVYFAVQNILAYIKEFGTPRVVMMLLPNLSRLLVPNSPAVAKIKKYKKVKKFAGKEILAATSSNSWGEKEDFYLSQRPTYQKFPLALEDLLYPELGYYLNLQHLNALETICQTLNIKLLWGTWSSENNELYRILREDNPNFFTNYIDLPSFVPGDLKTLSDCAQHDNLKDKYSHCFTLGGDKEWDGEPLEEHGHAGAHLHAHWAEKFLAEIEDLRQ